MHASAVFPDVISEPPTAIILVVDSHHQTEVRHPLSMETGPCACRVRIFTRAEGVVIVISEKPSSIRLTDTYALEQIASEVLSWAVNSSDRRDTITWVAQCPSLSEDRFFEIKFERFLDEEKYRSEKMRFGVFAWSNWKKISLDYLESLIGTKWEA